VEEFIGFRATFQEGESQHFVLEAAPPTGSTLSAQTSLKVQLYVRIPCFQPTCNFLSSVCPADACYRQTATAARLLPSAAPTLSWTATKSHLCYRVPATSHITHAVWTHCSTAEGRAGIFGEGERPTAVTCNYERLAERNSQTDRWAVFPWTAINLPHTCLVSRRLQWGRAICHTLDHLWHQGHWNAARQVAQVTELGTVAPNNCGSWVRNLVRVTHLALGFLSWLLHLWKNLCPSGVDCWKRDVNWKFWGTELRSPALWTVNAFLCHSCMTCNSVCITVNIPSAAHAGCNANSMLTMLCWFRHKCIFRQGVYMCCKSLLNHREIVSNYTKQHSTRQFARF